jgi:ribosomal protein S18 acetylase RimI-like enzyme
MNSSTIDITDIDGARLGDRVTIVGKQGDAEIDINELARNSGTISAELMTNFGKGVARTYEDDRDEDAPAMVVGQQADEEVVLHFVQGERSLPEGIEVSDVIEFLNSHLRPFQDPVETISLAVDYALSSIPDGRGFVLLATIGNRILGAVVNIELPHTGVTPGNLFVYVCVHQDRRRRGLGEMIIREAIACCDGDVKLHVAKLNPALGLYRRLGFRDDYHEMRYLKEGRET